jgi:hypothetical protein
LIDPDLSLQLWHQEHRERMRAARQWIEATAATRATADGPVRRATGLLSPVLRTCTNLLASLRWSAPEALTVECEE